MKQYDYDIVAIGGGTAGLVSAAGAAYLGANAALVEREALGGDCLWTGCVPSKAIIASARTAYAMRSAESLGLTPASPRHDQAAVMERMRAARGTVAHHDDPERFRAMGVDVRFGQARFRGPGELEVDGVGILRSKRFVIATGAEAWVPPIPGLEDAGYLTNATLFDTDSRPDALVVLGGGPIGLELAQVYARLGSRVTVLEMLSRVLPKEDDDVAELMVRSLTAEGLEIVTGSKVVRVDVESNGENGPPRKVAVTEDGRRYAADEILVATGRRPNTEGLGLDRVGVEIDRGVVTDDRLRTTAKGIWAAGDVVGGLQFTHVADYQAKVVLQNALLPVKKKANYSTVPWVTYTEPEIAHVGLSEADAHARGAKTYRYEFADLDRAIADGDTDGFVKISADKKGRILGATIVGAAAGELLTPITMAMTHGLTLPKIAGTIFPYPTKVEGVKRAADAFQRERLEGTGGRILRRVVRWLS